MKHSKDFKLNKDKDFIVEMLELLKLKVERISEEDISFDPEYTLYNQILTMIEEVEEIHSYPVLSEFINKAARIEHNIDEWLSERGKSTLSINWPQIK